MNATKFWHSVYGSKVKTRTFYTTYGKCYRFTLKQVRTIAIWVDTVVPMTLFIPVIVVNIALFVCGDKEFMFERKEQ